MNTRTHHLLPEVAALYPFDLNALTLIRSSQYSPNDIYAFIQNGHSYILRIATHDADNTELTAAEMEWLHFLHMRGVRVSMPLPMADGGLVASIADLGKHHAICAFEKAGGRHCDPAIEATWNERVFAKWGYTMACLHRETKAFVPRHERRVFDGSDALQDSLRHVPQIQRMTQALVQEILSLPRHLHNYGLIHYDFHPSNFFVDDGIINVFDFDDSLYGYFALDIGIALCHALLTGLPDCVEARQAAAERIIRGVMKGYRDGNALAPSDLITIPLFIRFRQLCNFAWGYEPGTHETPEMRDSLLNGDYAEGCRLDESWFLA